MTRFTKLVPTVLALLILAPLASANPPSFRPNYPNQQQQTPVQQNQPNRHGAATQQPVQTPQKPHTKTYHVYARSCPQSPWQVYGHTPEARTAQYHVQQLQAKGWDAYYR